jgi:hypothetical protein
MVAQEWDAISYGNTPMERWQNNIRHLHNLLRFGLGMKVAVI